MTRLIKRLQGGQKGFTLIELLVVIAILGVISAVVALNLGGFFGEGTLQAANTELHQVQTAVIALMAATQTGTLEGDGAWWAGGTANAPSVGNRTAAEFVYGPFRAAYFIETNGNIAEGCIGANFPADRDSWTGIYWSEINRNWSSTPDPNSGG